MTASSGVISSTVTMKVPQRSEVFKNKELCKPDNLYAYVESRATDDQTHYILLDEVQMLGQFEDVLNGFLKMRHVDVYVTGSNAKFLSKDIITEFRNTCLHITSVQAGLNEYMLYA